MNRAVCSAMIEVPPGTDSQRLPLTPRAWRGAEMLQQDSILEVVRSEKFARRFWAKVDKSGECWIWTAASMLRGYGVIGVANHVNVGAHRASWMMKHGAIAAGMCVLHRCDNPPCVRPSHLFVGTTLDNVRDMDDKGRRRCSPCQGEQNGRAKLSAAHVLEIRNLIMLGAPHRRIAKEYGVTKSAITRIGSGQAWATTE